MRSGDFARDAAHFARRVRLRIEEFDVRRPAAQKEQHDRFAGGIVPQALGCREAAAHPAAEREAEQAQAADAQKLSPPPALAVARAPLIVNRQHERLSRCYPSTPIDFIGYGRANVKSDAFAVE